MTLHNALGAIALDQTLQSILTKLASPATEGKQDSTLTALAAILAAFPADAATQTTLAALLARVPTALGQGTMANSLKVVLASDQSAVPVNQASQAFGGVPVSITRPANVTAYAAGDVVGPAAAAIAFPGMGPNGGSILITGASLEIDISAIPAGMTGFRLYLYSVTPPSALADNAAFDLVAGDRAAFAGCGFIDLGAPADLGSTLYVQADQVNHPVKLAGTGLFGYLVTNGGFTPAAVSEVYKVTLYGVAV